MSDENELKNFEVSCKIGLANSADYLGRCIPKMGKIEFNATAKKFSTRDPFQIELSVENLAQLSRKDCVNGKSMIIGFNKPSFKYNQLLLADLSEGDKQLIHKCLLKLVGVGTGRVNKPAPGGNKRPYPIQAANQSNSANLTFTAASKKTTTIPKSPSIIGSPNNFSNITTRRKLAVAPTIARSSPSMIDVSRTTTKVISTTPKSDTFGLQNNFVRKPAPTTPKSSIFGHQSSFITTRKPAPKTIPESPKMDMDDLLNNFEVPRTSMDDYSEMEKQPSKSPELNNKENYLLVRPEDELELPEKYKLDDFWTKLKMDEQIRSGMRGEWIKGQDEHLTVDGLLCLKDGQWLNADMMDAYLSFTAKRIDRVRYIPTYAILSYNRTKKIPSEWYWPLRDADMVLVPTHLNNNHWAMAVVDIPGRKIQMMDSMNNGFIGETKRKFMETIMDILFAVAEQQEEEEYLGERWRWDREELLEVPQQMNGTDCGIFALLFGRFAAERKPFPYNFSQQNIPYFRRRFCYDIVHTIQ